MRSAIVVVLLAILAAPARAEEDGRAIGLAHAMKLFQSWYRNADGASREKMVSQLSHLRNVGGGLAVPSVSASKAPVCGSAADRLQCMPPEESGPYLSRDELGHMRVSRERSSYTVHTHCCGRGGGHDTSAGPCWKPIHVDNRKIVLFESKHLEHRVGRAAWRQGAPAASLGSCSAGVVNLTRDTTPYPYWDLKTCMALTRKIATGAPLCEDRRRDPTGKTLIHVYWSALRSLHRHAFRLLASYLATQDLERTELWLWSPRKMEDDPIFAPFLHVPNIKTKLYNADAELSTGPLANHPRRKQLSGTVDGQAWADGDLFRLSILHKYGGLYLDGDTLLLRDMSPLLGMEFVYNWGNDCTLANGAIMRLHAGSEAGKGLLKTLATRRSGGTSWGPETYQQYWLATQRKGIDVLPTCFFNPHWLAGCEGCTPWSDATPSMWNGPFVIHVHGGIWRGVPPPTSDYCRVMELLAQHLSEMSPQTEGRPAWAVAGWADNITALLPCGSPDPNPRQHHARRHGVTGTIEAFLSGRGGGSKAGGGGGGWAVGSGKAVGHAGGRRP